MRRATVLGTRLSLVPGPGEEVGHGIPDLDEKI
jgi:hypothetical protein